jgi:hypothetical protein
VAAGDLRTLPVPTLQRMFLACEREAARRFMGLGDAAECSRVYEALLARGFEGDFKRLMAWWEAERAAAVAEFASKEPREARRSGD